MQRARSRSPEQSIIRHRIGETMFTLQQRERMDSVFERLAMSEFSGAVVVCEGANDSIMQTFGCVDSTPGNKITESTQFDICSVTKTFTAAAVRMLETEGRLSLEQSVADFADAIPAEMGGIRIHHLLNHSSGLADFLGPTGEPCEYSVDLDYAPLSREECWEQVRRSRLLCAPGERWSYSNTGYSLLAAIVERVTGEGFEEYLRRAVLQPLGMHDTGYVFHQSDNCRIACGYVGSLQLGRPVDKAERPSWNLIGNGGLLSTLSDLRQWRSAFCSPQPPAAARESPNHRILADLQNNIWSGYGMFFRETDPELGTIVYHNGSNTVFSATIRWFPQSDRYLTVMSSRSDVLAMPIAKALSDCWKAN
jgi:CubicO group peptidase (beta-lactamase class C family)